MNKAAPIPAFLLRQNVVIKTCTGVDAWQNPTYVSQAVQHVNVQPTAKTVLTKDNSQVQCVVTVFIDAVRSTPHIDIDAAKRESEAGGHPALVVFGAQEHTLVTLDTLYNPDGSVHHWEVGLV